MTAWDKALEFTLAYEGGYVFDPADRGGETFRGISRKAWPTWEGWAIVDRVKSAHPEDFKAVLLQDQDLRGRAVRFYRENFWDPVHGDELPGKVAAAVFDMAVHSGVKTAIRALQSCLPGVVVDGEVGSQTVKAVFAAGEAGLVDFLAARATFLNGIMVSSPDQKVWARNWFKRLFKLSNLVLEGPGIEFSQGAVS
jgi:lysozyme family protein